jgi:hypothetical protein
VNNPKQGDTAMAPQELLADFVEEDALADELHRHPRTIIRWTNQPDGLPFIKLGNRRLYHLPSVRDWLLHKLRKPNTRRAARASVLEAQ